MNLFTFIAIIITIILIGASLLENRRLKKELDMEKESNRILFNKLKKMLTDIPN